MRKEDMISFLTSQNQGDTVMIENLPFFVGSDGIPSYPQNIYLGIGFVRSNGQPAQGWGIDLLAFLHVADLCRRILKPNKSTIILMDQPFGRRPIDVSAHQILLQKLMDLLKMWHWGIELYTEELISVVPQEGYQTYPPFQAGLTAHLLRPSGVQVAWTYGGAYDPQKKDERYFAKVYRRIYSNGNGPDVGFCFFNLPGFLPGVTDGAPYIVSDRSKRLLLSETPDSARAKFAPGRNRRFGRNDKVIFPTKGAAIRDLRTFLGILSKMGMIGGIPSGGKKQDLWDLFLKGLGNLNDEIGELYEEAFPSYQQLF